MDQIAAAPPLGAHVHVPAGSYRLGEPGEERTVRLPWLAIGRWPVVNARFRRFVEATGLPVTPTLEGKLQDPGLADHPVTDVTFADAQVFCVWASGELGVRARLPTGDEWEAAARGMDGRAWPWGDVFVPGCCASAESGLGWTSPVTAYPDGASPSGAQDMAGNVWEWVLDRTEEGSWRSCRGGSFLDHAWGVRVTRSLPADPRRPTRTTGFRLLIEIEEGCCDTQ
ncbi:MAG: formylglycine-generating enzyme family protein [Egibacteraceae bacterium]